ncbi:uncharacterized protein LOC133205794 [Saccostrea echinata]|uniref:uncharacterized protein LOC133205794 n=1 Tax=Saccostrea echinata TaxID=191078 RepID=UPI002A83AB85|nr:uncharacterized protein LOC133205794 [Saccostrea echinata]XP_061197656.1 uncharacterized protein LOC133205794 [Saccostrea echinata]
MSSFFNWLCFPSRHVRSKQKSKLSRNLDDEGGFLSVKQQKRKLSRNTTQRTDYVRKQASFSEQDRKYQVKSEQRLEDSTVPNKRRRVQEIFNLPNTERSDSITSRNNGSKYSRNIRAKGDFGSEYTPRMYYHNHNSIGNKSESMYGYVPKTMQTCTASKALEGNRVDDFFSNLHRENALNLFGKMSSSNCRQNQMMPKFTFTHSQSQTSLSTADKVSLIESEELTNVDDLPLNCGEFYSNISSRVNSILEASFDSMWNSNGEVLY